MIPEAGSSTRSTALNGTKSLSENLPDRPLYRRGPPAPPRQVAVFGARRPRRVEADMGFRIGSKLSVFFGLYLNRLGSRLRQ
jgi:hypothetical protein